MPFTKGDKNINRSGRPRGSHSKGAEQARLMIQKFVEGKLPDLNKVWNQLEPKEQMIFIDKMLRHTLPPPVRDISDFTEDELDALIERLQERHNSN